MNKIVTPRVMESEKRTVTDFIGGLETSFSNIRTEKRFKRELMENEFLTPPEKCAMIKDNEADIEGTTVLMPIKHQIKKFFELPGVYKKITDYHAAIRQEGKLNHFINGELWNNVLKHFDDDQIVLPYFYYADGAQLNHPIGPHCKKGQQDFHYFSFLIPTQYQSRLENIFVSYLLPGMKSF